MSEFVAALEAIGSLHSPDHGACVECRKTFPCPTFQMIENAVQAWKRSSGLVVPPGSQITYTERRSDWILAPKSES